MKKCMFIGTFDPFHNGHLSVVKKLSVDYDIVYVFIAKNYLKMNKRMFSAEIMQKAIIAALKENGITNAVCVECSHFLPCSYVSKMLKCKSFCRGMKEEDATLNYFLEKIHSVFHIDTVYYNSDCNYSSRKIKKAFLEGKDISKFVPTSINKLFAKKNKTQRCRRFVSSIISKAQNFAK